MPITLEENGGKRMDGSKFDAPIRDLKEQMDTLREQMEKTCKEFLEATKEFAPTWFQKSVERAVTSQPELAKECGVNGLRSLKSDLQKLVAMIPHIVEQHVNCDKYWPHRAELPDEPELKFGRYHISKPRGPDELDNGVREILGYVGAILVKYGFAKTGEFGNWVAGYGSERPRYRFGYDWSEKMSSVLNKYSPLYDELVKLNEKLKKVEREKAEAEAKDLWEQA